MPPGSSHLCQPLDVSYFAPLKKAYYGLVERLARARYLKINKGDFLEKYPKAHTMAFKEANIRSAFKASDLVPYDPNQMLDKLIYKNFDSRPSSQDSRSTISKTPVNTNQFKKQEARLEQLLSSVADTPMKSALDYVFKGAEMALNRAVLLEQEVRELRWANERLNTKKRRRNKQLTGLNGFTVNEAREAFQR
ncbi:hypothetical protein ASPACDRAFT_128321, partial [Aspergillus aculeatus ATCC 16872]